MINNFPKLKTVWPNQYKELVSLQTLISFMFLIGIVICSVFMVNTIVKQYPLFDHIMTAAALLSAILGFYFVRQGNLHLTFQIFGTITTAIILTVISYSEGIQSITLYVLYPLLLMVGISSWNKPKFMRIFSIIYLGWIIGIAILGVNGYYEQGIDPFQVITVTFSFFFMVVMLRLTSNNFWRMTQDLVNAKEDALFARDVAESANESKSAFLARMSHELRTPLNAIKGYSEMIEEDAIDEIASFSDLAVDAKKINQSAEGLLKMIDSILEFSQTTPTSKQLVVELVSVSEILKQATQLTEFSFVENQNSLKTDPPAEDYWVAGDRQKLIQVCANLIKNAKKFTQNGTITLHAEQTNNDVRISVSDTGIGIPTGQTEKIFLPFEQVSGDYDREYEGAGLGLAIAKDYIEQMNGKIEVMSEINQGSTFTIILPAAPSPDSSE